MPVSGPYFWPFLGGMLSLVLVEACAGTLFRAGGWALFLGPLGCFVLSGDGGLAVVQLLEPAGIRRAASIAAELR